jgi:hypothetical protein
MYFKDNFLHPERYSIASACVNYLSSYWEQHQFTVHYPLNISLVNGWTINCNTVNQSIGNLIASAKSFLNLNYPPTSFIQNTVANVIFFLYNVPVNPSDPNDLITSTTSPDFSYTTRVMDADFLKKSIHFGDGVNVKFNNDGNGNWVFLDYTNGNTYQEPDPIPYKIDLSRVPISIGGGRVKIELNITGDDSNYDVFKAAVSTGKYAYGATDVIVTINKGVNLGGLIVSDGFVSANTNGNIDGDTVTVINNGNILGYGGAGGLGGAGDDNPDKSNGGDGGDAITLVFPTSIENNGIIGGGGGGGAGSAGLIYNTAKPYFFGIITFHGTVYVGGSGGGGAGYPVGPGGLFDDSTAIAATKFTLKGSIWTREIVYNQAGTSGDLFIGGKGGAGTGLSNTVVLKNVMTILNANKTILTGANGGAIGVDGGSVGKKITKTKVQLPPYGGKAGNAVFGKGYLTWLTKGTIYGNVV